MTDQTTSTAIANLDDPEFQRKLAAMAGQFVGGSANFIPKLSVNNVLEDPKTKVDLAPFAGSFFTTVKDHGRVYAKRKAPIQFRLYAKRYGYVKFDATADNGPGKKPGATTARSVQLADFKKGSEYISDDGTFKCGKASLPEGAKNPTIRTKIFLYGTVTYTGTAFNKENVPYEVEVVNEPVTVQVSGKQFMTVDGLLKDFSKDGRRFFDHALTLTSEYVSLPNGGVYNINFEFTDLTKRLEFTEEVFKTLEKFADYIEANNKAIEVKFNQKINQANVPDEAADIELAGNDLENDFIEEEHED